MKRWSASDARPRSSHVRVMQTTLLLAAAALVWWNMSMLSAMTNTKAATDAALKQPAGPMLRAQEHSTAADDVATEPAVVATEKPWFLEPESYMKETGCDFSAAVELFDPSQLQINCGNIHKLQHGEFLGQGFWRQVFRSEWNGQSVAVKVVKERLLDRLDILPRHVEEAAAMFPIRNEPNIVSLVGWCNSTVVVEYVPLKLDELVFTRENELSVQRALVLGRDAARGLMQLHEAPGGPFAHTDIQTRQFLVDTNGRLKLNDFNRVKYVGPCLLPSEASTKCTSPVVVAKGKWRAPEEYERRDIDEKADIYSLSLVLWSLRARTHPFDDLEKDQVYVQVPQGKRPDLSAMADYPLEMQQLIKRGWNYNPQKRPTARELASQIDTILKKYVASTHGE